MPARRALLLVAIALIVWPACRDKGLPVADGLHRDLAAGRMIYERKCASCHGATGDGKTITASRHKFANLLDGEWRSDGSLEAVERQIRFGRDPMPRFQGKLTDEEIRQTAAFVLELSRVARGPATSGATSR